MRRVDEPISKEYLPLRLFLDDLQEIENILKGPAQSVSIKVRGFEFDSIDEFSKNSGHRKITDLQITCSTPYVSLEFTRFSARLYVGSSDDTAAGLFHKLDQLLTQSRIPFWFLHSYYFVWVLNILLPLNTAVVSNEPTSTSVSLVAGAWIFRVLYVRLRRHSTVILSNRNERSTFLSRKKDDLILALISGIIGALLGIAGTLIVNQLTR
jgi:hypothetical protein